MRSDSNAWHDGQILAFSGLDGFVSQADGLVATTRGGSPAGLDIRWPGKAAVDFPEGPLSRVRVTSDAFSATLAGRAIGGRLPDARHVLLSGCCRLRSSDPCFRTESSGGRLLIGPRDGFNADHLSVGLPEGDAETVMFRDRFPVPVGLDARAAAAYRKAVAILRGQVYSPEGRIRHRWTTPDRWPHRDMWLWDSAFHAIGWRHLDPGMARDALSAVLDCQREDGFIPHQMNAARSSAVTQPPLLALAVTLVHEVEPAVAWIASLYPGLARYLAWDAANRDADGDGLLEWRIEADPQCRSGESGMDNSPRFDGAQALAAVDFNAFMALECDCMAGLARELGKPDEAARWEGQAESMRGRINGQLWDERRGFYFDLDPARNAWTGIRACSGFLPLVCGAPTPAMARRLAGHLGRNGAFDTALPVASIPPGDSAYDRDMWRGPSWLNMSWLIAGGFARYGMGEVAGGLRERWMNVLIRDHERYGTLFEYYDAEDAVPPPSLRRKGKASDAHPHQVIRDYGWTAALFVDWCHRPVPGRGVRSAGAPAPER